MKRESIAIFAIIAAGSFLGLAYGVTNGSILTGDLTVTGTCTGCGGGEGSFTSYATALNSTIVGTGDNRASNLMVSTNGTVFVLDVAHAVYLIKIDGSATTIATGLDSKDTIYGYQNIAQSQTGKYKAVLDDPNSVIKVYKNDNLLQNIGYNATQFGAIPGDTPAIGISSDGKYIAMYKANASATDMILLIFRGT